MIRDSLRSKKLTFDKINKRKKNINANRCNDQGKIVNVESFNNIPYIFNVILTFFEFFKALSMNEALQDPVCKNLPGT